jgi:predicted dehydrogenase
VQHELLSETAVQEKVMLRIGFVDHHLNNFHANKFLSLLHGPLADQDARVMLAWETDPTGEDWCAKNGIRRADSAEAVARECDVVMVLAPDNIDTHLGLCRKVFPAGKPALVDKFLATNLKDAKEIVDLAETHGNKLFSASSLRFAVELKDALKEGDGQPVDAFARGMGDWNGYGVHTLSLAIGALGADVKRLIDTGNAKNAALTLEYRDGRRAWIDVRAAENMWKALPWSFGVRIGDKYVTRTVKDFDGFYANLMREAVTFFKTGKSPVSTDEMLRVVAILESAAKSRASGAWIQL